MNDNLTKGEIKEEIKNLEDMVGLYFFFYSRNNSNDEDASFVFMYLSTFCNALCKGLEPSLFDGIQPRNSPHNFCETIEKNLIRKIIDVYKFIKHSSISFEAKKELSEQVLEIMEAKIDEIKTIPVTLDLTKRF